MKTTGACVKCSNPELYHTPCVMDRGEGNAAMCLSVRRSDSIEARDLGRFEVYVCTSCGYTEFYAQQPHELKEGE
jgi:predicted nucleic-acid-binding Zn-ribbon protein